MEKADKQRNGYFWFHLFITALAWLAPFLVDWRVMAAVAGLLTLQFLVLGRCILNRAHGLEGDGDATFYSHLFESAGLRPDRARLKKVVHRWLYPALAAAAFGWQVGLGFKPVLF